MEAGAEAGVAVAVSVRPRGQRGARANRPAAWARDLATAGRQAVIAVTSELAAADLTALSRARLPLVVIDPLNLPSARVTSVGSTNFAGGLAATQHLLVLGHRRIAYLGGPATAACNQARMHGYRGAMEAAGAPVPDGYVRTGRFSYEDGLDGGDALLDLPRAAHRGVRRQRRDRAGVIEAARARGLRIPEDLSVVGFDDTQVARLASPPLTTVRQPLREMGGVAVRTALRLAAGEQLDSHHVELATELVVRSRPRSDPSDCRQPGRRAVVVVARLHPVRFDGGDLPSDAGVERRAQLLPTDGVRAGVGSFVAEAQHIQGPVVLGHRRETRHVPWSLVGVEGVEQSAVQHRREPASQPFQLERVSRGERDLDPTVVGLGAGDRQCRLSHVNAQDRQSQRGEVERVLAGPAARIEHRSGEPAFGCQPHDRRLRPANVPGRRAVVVRRIPGQSGQPFVTGRVPTTERILSQGP